MITTETILKHRVYIGQDFTSYAKLCAYLGVPVTKGKQRQLDIRHLNCYFSWENIEHSQKIIITDIFYDQPREFEDGRTGIHTTEIGSQMQQLFRATKWKKPAYSLTSMLFEMQLMTNDIFEKSLRESQSGQKFQRAYRDYTAKIFRHLKSTINQLEKKGLIHAPQCVFDAEDNVQPESLANRFREIRGEVLGKFHVENEYKIIMMGIEKAYHQELNRRTYEALGKRNLREAYQITITNADNIIPADRNALLRLAADEMKQTYEQHNSKAWGTAAPQEYNKQVDKLIQQLICAQSPV